TRLGGSPEVHITRRGNIRWDPGTPGDADGGNERPVVLRAVRKRRYVAWSGDVRLAMAKRNRERGPGGVPEREELLSTKVAIPRIRPELLTRSPLLEALDQATVRGLTLVCTPPGFGKTTLLAQWAQIARGRVAWRYLSH